MRRLALFSKYFGYDVGGAERSVLAQLEAEERSGAEIEVVLVRNPSGFGRVPGPLALPAAWRVTPFDLKPSLRRFKYVEYACNRGGIGRTIAALSPGTELVAYGVLAPAALLAHGGPSTYMVRDELGVGIDGNYYVGWRRWAKSAYVALEAPFRWLWLRDLRRVFRRADRIVVNSRFNAGLVESRFGVERARIEVLLPSLDEEGLRERWTRAGRAAADERGVVCVGDSVMKGTDIVRRLAARMPGVTFHLFDRGFGREERVGNLWFHPWAPDSVGVYRYADVVIVPSRCNEAFSRVAREARILNLPVLASDRGGIPEAVEYPAADAPSVLIEDIDRIEAWQEALGSLLSACRG